MSTRRVVVLGDLATDVVARLAQPVSVGSDATAAITTAGGGSGANVAAWLAHAGATVSFMGAVGRDAAGRERVRELRDLAVDVRVSEADAATGTVIVLVAPGGERTMFPDRGANLALSPSDVPADLFGDGNHLHLSGYTLFTDPPRSAGLHALDLARSAGMTISVDPSSVEPLRDVGSEAFLDWTRGADICFPNAAEALALSGAADLDDALAALAGRYRQAVITNGPLGALWGDATRQVAVAASPMAVRDTTGAGDAFAAGFLRAFVDGEPPEACLAAATAVAAVAVRQDGARPPTT